MNAPARILVSGMIAADPFQGGATWAVLQYVLGLRQLGHQVWFVEPVPAKALRPSGSPLNLSANAAYFRQVTAEFNLADSSALLLARTNETVGLPYDQLRRLARQTDLLLNISGMLEDQNLAASISTRVYLDLDPGFNQLWSAVQGIDMRFASHNHFVTIGQQIGEPGCSVPTCGHAWHKTLQPIVLSLWPSEEQVPINAITTVGNWRGYGSIQHEGVFYGQKAHSFREFFCLPRLTDEKFQLALAIHPNETKDLEAMAANGWTLMDPAQVAGTPDSYRRFIQQSKAELGIAKSGYVASRCGWFSDRSVCYLASGRPVLAQETGFSQSLPTGEGLFAFKNIDEVLRGIEQLRADYPKQAKSARAIAEEYFDSRKVLSQLLQQAGIPT